MSDRRNRRLALGLAVVVPAMIGASYAAVPLYDLFCKVTGYGGTTNTAAAAPEGPARPEVVTIRFDANAQPGMPIAFRPMARTMKLHVGETGLAFYEMENLSDERIAATATFNVTPHSTGTFFDKIACFCFEMQELGPRERVEMPVTFFVDPAMLEDSEAGGVRTITLSYTMHPAALPAGQDIATAASPASPDQNARN